MVSSRRSVRFRWLDARVFGMLRGLRIELPPEGALVFGSNESGKSSFRGALETILYGFDPADRETHPLATWDGGAGGDLALEAEIERDTGRGCARSACCWRAASSGSPKGAPDSRHAAGQSAARLRSGAAARAVPHGLLARARPARRARQGCAGACRRPAAPASRAARSASDRRGAQGAARGAPGALALESTRKAGVRALEGRDRGASSRSRRGGAAGARAAGRTRRAGAPRGEPRRARRGAHPTRTHQRRRPLSARSRGAGAPAARAAVRRSTSARSARIRCATQWSWRTERRADRRGARSRAAARARRGIARRERTLAARRGVGCRPRPFYRR